MSTKTGADDYGTIIDHETVRFERLLPGPAERVWQYLVESDKRAKWLAAGIMEERVGSTVELHFDNSNLGSEPSAPPERLKQHGGTHIGEHLITIYEPPTTLGFTWGGKDGLPPSEVVFELTPKGNDILLTVTHSYLGSLRGVSSGWHTHLNLLRDILNGRESGSFWKKFEAIDDEYAERLGK